MRPAPDVAGKGVRSVSKQIQECSRQKERLESADSCVSLFTYDIRMEGRLITKSTSSLCLGQIGRPPGFGNTLPTEPVLTLHLCAGETRHAPQCDKSDAI